MKRFTRQRPPVPLLLTPVPEDPPNLDYYSRPLPGRGPARTPVPTVREEAEREQAPRVRTPAQ